jgi:hypothetical protein
MSSGMVPNKTYCTFYVLVNLYTHISCQNTKPPSYIVELPQPFFFGYDEHSKAYRCLDATTHKLFLSRSIKTNETFQFPSIGNSRFIEPKVIDAAALTPKHEKPYIPESQIDGEDTDDEEDVHDDANNDIIEIDYSSTYESCADSDSDPDDSHPSLQQFPNPTAISKDNIIGSLNSPRSSRSQAHFALQGLSTTTHLPPPNQYKDIHGRPDAQEWYDACKREWDGLNKRNFGDLVQLPAGCIAIPTRHVFTRKDTGITKCRIVVRGDLQPKDDG